MQLGSVVFECTFVLSTEQISGVILQIRKEVHFQFSWIYSQIYKGLCLDWWVEGLRLRFEGLLGDLVELVGVLASDPLEGDFPVVAEDATGFRTSDQTRTGWCAQKIEAKYCLKSICVQHQAISRNCVMLVIPS